MISPFHLASESLRLPCAVFLGVSLVSGGTGHSIALGEGPASAGDELFRKQVAPLLASKCGQCHGPEAAESGFRIDQREKAIAGGDSGSVGIVAGKPAESEVFVRITTDDKEAVMPAEGAPLSAAEKAVVKAWIEAGAQWPDDMESLPKSLLPTPQPKPDAAAAHWAFHPLARPPVPKMAGQLPSGQSPNPIDAFIGERLAEKNLEMNPEADPRTLIRRVSFDLIGLPPSPEEITAFEEECRKAGGAEGPYGELINRLLASPHYGERWARHWLDVVRFAESHGFETNRERPNAWPYRDYVIESFNTDKPYDQFVREQIAGDSFGADVATGFLVGGPRDNVKSPDRVLQANQRADELHDMVSTTASTFMGLTVGCARCHDHKFDPIPQVDYFRMKAVFAGVIHTDRELPPKDDSGRQQKIANLERELESATRRLQELREGSESSLLKPQVSAGENVDSFPETRAKFVKFTVLATTEGQPCIDEIEVFDTDGTNVARGATPKASGVFSNGNHPSHKLEHISDGHYGNSRSWVSNQAGKGWIQLEMPEPKNVHRVAWSRDRSPTSQFSDRLATKYQIAVSLDGKKWQVVASDRDRIPHGSVAPVVEQLVDLSPNERAEAESLITTSADIEKQLKELRNVPTAYIGKFVQPGKTFRFFRGDPMAPREPVAPGSLTRLGDVWELEESGPERERRRKLAEWVASAKNPLTARVIANRLWHYHFGTGIVDTPSDLGVNGGTPSHRALLDWLASELIDGGWRLKQLHRLIVMSRTYRQSSEARSDGLAADSDSRLLWRYPPRRLEAEPLRDSILTVSGSLNKKMGGPGFDLFEPNGNYVKVYTTKTKFTDEDFRRMVYQMKPRSELDSFFGAFDCPDAGQIQPKRTVSTTPLQALNMLNGDFLLDQSSRFAARVQREVGDSPTKQVARALLLAFGREATPVELAAGTTLVEAHGLPMLCRSLYNASEFITIY